MTHSRVSTSLYRHACYTVRPGIPGRGGPASWAGHGCHRLGRRNSVPSLRLLVTAIPQCRVGRNQFWPRLLGPLNLSLFVVIHVCLGWCLSAVVSFCVTTRRPFGSKFDKPNRAEAGCLFHPSFSPLGPLFWRTSFCVCSFASHTSQHFGEWGFHQGIALFLYPSRPLGRTSGNCCRHGTFLPPVIPSLPGRRMFSV